MTVYRILVGKTETIIPLRRPRRRWVDNIKIDLTEIRWGVMNLNGVAQDRSN
jgi:hypothetical protein